MMPEQPRPQRGDPIIFYFDFSSPYAWIAFDEVHRIARAAGRELELRPILVWAVLKHHGIAAPFDSPARRDYMLGDMKRSADFMGVQLLLPQDLPVSAHVAARLWIGAAQAEPDRAIELARAIFAARFVEGQDIRDPVVLATATGLPREAADRHIAAPENRDALAATIAQAIEDGVCGAPFFLCDGEGFFGADRLAQLRWRLDLPLDP